MTDASAFQAFYARSLRPLAAHLRRLGAVHPQDLEDVIQETYVQAFRGWDALQSDEAAIGWLLTIGRRQLWRQRERRRRRGPEVGLLVVDEQGVDDNGASPGDGGPVAAASVRAAHGGDIESQLDARRVTRGVAALLDGMKDQKKRAVIEMFYLQEMPLPEVGAATGVKTSTMTTWLSRFRAEARRVLQDGARSRPAAPLRATRESPSSLSTPDAAASAVGLGSKRRTV